MKSQFVLLSMNEGKGLCILGFSGYMGKELAHRLISQRPDAIMVFVDDEWLVAFISPSPMQSFEIEEYGFRFVGVDGRIIVSNLCEDSVRELLRRAQIMPSDLFSRIVTLFKTSSMSFGEVA